jgi:nucleoside 2-deoxyribosyltransferase
MKITVCGSISFMAEMKKLQTELLKMGFNEVFIPKGFENENTDDPTLKDSLSVEEDSQRKIEHDLIRRHFNLIAQSDCVLIANYSKKGIENYIGGNTFLEMGFAFVLGKPLFVINPLPDLPYITEMQGMEPQIINADLSKIKAYYQHFN